MLREVVSEPYSVTNFSQRHDSILHHPPPPPPHMHFRPGNNFGKQCALSSQVKCCSSHEYSNQDRTTGLTLLAMQEKDENFNPTPTPHPHQHNNQMKNVHFSPVVSQLCYPQVELRQQSYHLPQFNQNQRAHNINSANESSESDRAIQKVKVHVQQIEKPLQQRVQRIQVSVPHQNGEGGSDRRTFDLGDILRRNESNNGHDYQNWCAIQTQPPPVLFSSKISTSSPAEICPVKCNTHKNRWSEKYWNKKKLTDVAQEERVLEASPPGTKAAPASTKSHAPQIFPSSDFSCDTTLAQMHIPEKNVHVKVNINNSIVPPPDERINEKINNFENALIYNHSNGAGAGVSKNVNDIGSLEEFLEVELRTPEKRTALIEHGGKSGGEVSNSNSWPSAYRKLKEKSKPKLSFLHKLTFGRFGNGSGTKEKSKGWKKSQKRSSCPPLGHPILLSTGGLEDGIEEVEEFKVNDLNNSVALNGMSSDPGLPKDFQRNCEIKTSELKECLEVNDGIRTTDPPFNLNVTSDLPPKPYARLRKSSSSQQKCSPKTRIQQMEHNHADELSLNFERILEGILDLECDGVVDGGNVKTTPFKRNVYHSGSSSGQSMECENFGEDEVDRVVLSENLGTPHIPMSGMDGKVPLNGNHHHPLLHESGSNGNGASQTIPNFSGDDQNKACIPVVGKPPRPPSSANRHLGMRTGASERFSYLRGRMSATATTETRLAMELAAKLCEFREELHRSREEIAKSHPNLEEIENSVRISMAIDRCQRTLPQSRNQTRVSLSLPPALLKHDDHPIAATTTTVSAPSSSSAQDEPVKPVTEIIREEWESVVLRAKEILSRTSHQHHNNGKSDPLESRGIVLETDLDTGASREFPVDNSFSCGDASRRRDLEKVLKVEDFPASLVQRNSCSLQNLSFVPTSVMATLTPGEPGGKEDRSRSMEFLVDDSVKHAHLMPPENTLMKNQETRRVSEHELRIQRSLQKLNVPDWYKNYAPGSASASAAGTPSKSRDFGSGTGLAGGWPGLSTSKTSSLTSLQSAGRYTGSRTGFGSARHRSTGTASTGGRSSRESLMSPSSTASASPSPYFERSSFTYGMPYALTRFAAARMSCGASPASLSPSPSPVGGIGTSTSTPVSSGPAARYGYQKQPYLGWRSQERLNQKSLYRSPAERLAADLIAQKAKPTTPVVEIAPPEIEVKTSPKKETASSDLSLNNSEESNSHKLNRVRSSIKEVSNAIVDYVNETKPLDDGMNGRASPRRGLVWLESSFVGTKPIDSPGTPDTPSTFMSHRGSRKDPAFRFDESAERSKENAELKSGESSSTSHYTSYISRNEQMEERSNSSSVSSPTLEDILDSLLALRRPNKKFRSRGKGHETTKAGGDGGEPDVPFSTTLTSSSEEKPLQQRATIHHYQQQVRPSPPQYQYQYEPSTTSEISSTPSSTKHRYHQTSSSSSSDWQDRMNQPLADSTFISGEPETFTLTGSSRAGGNGNGVHSPLPPVRSIISSSSNEETSSHHPPVVDRFSSASMSSSSGVGGGVTTMMMMNESVVRSSSSTSSNPIHSASSSIHSTPTHRQYQISYQRSSDHPDLDNDQPERQQHNQSVVASSKEYSSCGSSPAKSCFDSSTTQRDDNELRQSLLRDEEELAFGNPTEIRSTVTNSVVAPITGGVIVNPLTGLSEYSNPPTPARHRRVSFDLDFSDKEEKSSSRSRNKDENVGGTIQCRNTKCGKTATGLEARREFKVCHNCNAYYCSRECRRAHWEKHKKVCMQSRVGAICKQIISHVKEDSYVMNQLSTVAKRGFLAKGRGCVKLFFNSPDRAERFLSGGLPELPEPLYIPHSDMLPEEMGAQTFSEISDQCRSYNSETRFVLYACVCVVNEVPTYGAVKWERELISRSSKLRLLLPRTFYEETQRHHHAPANPAHLMSALPDPTTNNSGGTSPGSQSSQQQPNVPLYDRVTPSLPSGDEFPPPPPPHQNTSTTSENETLILRSVPPPSSHQLSSSEHRRLREVSFANIQKHLILRGVDLKRTYPDIFMKLCRYVEQDEPFLPVTIYPKNSQTGRQFVCVIMPESSDSAYSAATEESGQMHPLQRVETINISEQDDEDIT